MQSLFGQDAGCIIHKTRPCVQDDRVGSHFDLSRIIDKQVAGAIRLRNTRPRKSCAIWQSIPGVAFRVGIHRIQAFKRVVEVSW